MEIIHTQEKKLKEKEIFFLNLQESWENIKCINVHIIGILESEERKKELEKIFKEIILEKISNLEKETDIKVQEARRY